MGAELISTYYEEILIPTANECEQQRRLLDAIKLYNLAGSHATVVSCLTRALGDLVVEPLAGGPEGVNLEGLARSILEHYSRRGDVTGVEKQNLLCLLSVREASAAFEQKHYETALEVRVVFYFPFKNRSTGID